MKDETVAKVFEKKFKRHQHKKIVLYGLGQSTKAILEKTKGFQFVGLLSPEAGDIGKQFFGITVLAFENVIDICPIVIIVAREEVEQTILREISYLNKNHGIKIFFKNGGSAKLLPECLPHSSWKSGEPELMEKIEKYGAVSFDVFDTLITRRIEKPSDVFLVVDRRCKKIFGTLFDYYHLRLDVESRLQSHASYASIVELYKEMTKLDSDFGLHMSEVLSFELEVEANLIVPCSRMIEIYSKLLLKGKPLFLISDMYLPKSFIEGILNAYGIDGYEALFVSADDGQSKIGGGLFKEIQSHFNGSILHIGDNLRSDVDMAIKSGIDAYHVLSARDYLASSSMCSIIQAGKPIGDRITIGLIANRVFGDPFIRLDKTNGIPVISSLKDFGFIIFGPLAHGYISWLCKRCKDIGIGKILFCARDGFFLKRLYEMLRLLNGYYELPESVYFRTSRRMGTVVSLIEWDDIVNSFNRHRYFGTFKNLMLQRFSIIIPDTDEISNQLVNTSDDLDTALSLISRYEEEILDQAKKERQAFIKYVNSICNFEKTIVALSDSGCMGTVQMAIEKTLDTYGNLHGLHVCASKNINPYGLERLDGFLNQTKHTFLEYQHLFESVFTGPEGCYLRCNDDGSFENGPKYSNQKNWNYKEMIFLGIRDYFNEYLKAYPYQKFESCSSDLANMICELVDEGKVVVDERVKETFYFDNPYVRDQDNPIIF